MENLDAKGFGEKLRKLMGLGHAWARLMEEAEVLTSGPNHLASEGEPSY